MLQHVRLERIYHVHHLQNQRLLTPPDVPFQRAFQRQHVLQPRKQNRLSHCKHLPRHACKPAPPHKERLEVVHLHRENTNLHLLQNLEQIDHLPPQRVMQKSEQLHRPVLHLMLHKSDLWRRHFRAPKRNNLPLPPRLHPSTTAAVSNRSSAWKPLWRRFRKSRRSRRASGRSIDARAHANDWCLRRGACAAVGRDGGGAVGEAVDVVRTTGAVGFIGGS
mmetsp:Transcript_11378/g.24526  ORF Transcript_11378/g.24526 Transcript_11378/m.24526 type:complete len:220 (+) Transcript_11378:219-878(+)